MLGYISLSSDLYWFSCTMFIESRSRS